MSYISFGVYNKYLKYIIFHIISTLLYEATFGLNYGNVYKEIIFFEKQKSFSSHRLINSIFCYFGILLFSLILYKFDPNRKTKISNKRHNSKIELIHYDNKSIKKDNYTIILVSFLWVIHEQLAINYYYFNFVYLDYWTLELIIAYYISKTMFNIQIHNHQKFAIFFNSVLCSILIWLPFIVSLIDGETNNLKEKPVLILTGIISYLIIMFIRSYSNCKIKWISDLKDISVCRFLVYYGLFGTIISTIVSLVTTNAECNIDEYIYCYLEKDGKKYFEHFSIFYEDFSSSKLIFIFLIILNIIFGFLKSLFYILIIKYLTPFHAITLPSIYYFLLLVILFFYTLINKKENRDSKGIEVLSTACDTIADFFTIIGTSIYSEIIELNFCKLDYNLKRNIIKRGDLDLSFITNSKETKEGQLFPINDDDEEEEEEENEKINEISESKNK